MTHELLALGIEKVIAFCFPLKVDSRLATLSMLIELLGIFTAPPVLTVKVPPVLAVMFGAAIFIVKVAPNDKLDLPFNVFVQVATLAIAIESFGIVNVPVAVKFVVLFADALTVPINVEELPPTSRANVESVPLDVLNTTTAF
jgi:hypothetical protein